jgi:hypothetical protein
MRDLMQRPENADFIGDAWSTYPLEREQRKGAAVRQLAQPSAARCKGRPRRPSQERRPAG